MEHQKLKVSDCDGDVSDILELYNQDENLTKFGALHILGLPPSRQKLPTGYGSHPALASLDGAVISASEMENFPGIYAFQGQPMRLPLREWKQIKSQALSVQDEAPLDFMETLSSGGPFGIQSTDEREYNTSQRMELGLKVWPFRRADPALRIAADDSGFQNLRTSTVTILSKGGPIKALTPLANLHVVCYHHEGAPIHWIVVPPSQRQLFESRLREAFNIQDGPLCSQFVSHLCIWIDPKVLKFWGVDYYEIQQEPGQVLCTFPGAYAWGHSTGLAIIERKHYSSKASKIDNDFFCNMQTADCQRANPAGVPMRLSQEVLDKIEKISKEGTQLTRIRKASGAQPRNLTKENYEAAAAWSDTSPTPKFRKVAASRGDETHSGRLERLYQGTPNSQIDPALLQDGPAATDPDYDSFYFSDGDEGLSFLTPVSDDELASGNAVLLNNLQKLCQDRFYLYRRKEMYKKQLYAALEGPPRVSGPEEEQQLAEGDQNRWKIAALTAFDELDHRKMEILEHEKRIGELNAELAELRVLKLKGAAELAGESEGYHY